MCSYLGVSQQVFDSKEKEGQIELSILESGHFLVSQSEELLVSVSMLLLLWLHFHEFQLTINHVLCLSYLIFLHYFFSLCCL